MPGRPRSVPGEQADKGTGGNGPLPAVLRIVAGWPGVRVSSKHNGVSFQSGGKVFAFTRWEELVVKLPGTRIRQLQVEAGAAFLKMGTRGMKEWAVLSPSALGNAEAVAGLLREAMEFAAGVPALKGTAGK